MLEIKKIAVILDDFSFKSFSLTDVGVQVRPDFDPSKISPDEFLLFFSESAWSGFSNEWCKKVSYASSELKEVVSFFKGNSIPTCFWSKEDPVHFNRFLAAASEFDFVFTTDISCVSLYKQLLGNL